MSVESLAQAFMRENADLAYDDSKGEAFWEKVEQVATRTGGGYLFEDGSELIGDPMGCSIQSTGPAIVPRPRERG